MGSDEANGRLIAMLVHVKGQEGLLRARSLGDIVVSRKPTRMLDFSALNADNSMKFMGNSQVQLRYIMPRHKSLRNSLVTPTASRRMVNSY